MLQLISKLQRRPEHVRRKIALVASVSVTGVIVVVWLIGLSFREPAAPVADEPEASPFAALGKGFSAIVSDAKATYEKMTGAVSAFSEGSTTTVEAPASNE